MKKTWSSCKSKTVTECEGLENVMDPTGNFKNYRAEIASLEEVTLRSSLVMRMRTPLHLSCDLVRSFAHSFDRCPPSPLLPQHTHIIISTVCRRMRAFRSSACSLRTCTLSTRELRPCESLAVLFPSLFLPAQAPAPSTHPPSFTLIIVRLTDCCFFAPPQPP